MDPDWMKHWRLSADLSVVHAALLMAGIDPSSEVGANCDGWKTSEQPPAFVAAKAALTTAIMNGRLEAKSRRSAWHRGWDEEPEEGESVVRAEVYPDHSAEAESPGASGHSPALITKLRKVVYRATPDWNLTTVDVETLRDWLSARGIRNGFFFPQAKQATDLPPYLDKNHPRYAPWLAAAVLAWLHAAPIAGRSVKAGLVQWLRKHAAEFSLSASGISDCSKVANWGRAGGAPKSSAN